MDGWIDGWMDRWMDGWIDGWMDRWMDGWIVYTCAYIYMYIYIYITIIYSIHTTSHYPVWAPRSPRKWRYMRRSARTEGARADGCKGFAPHLSRQLRFFYSDHMWPPRITKKGFLTIYWIVGTCLGAYLWSGWVEYPWNIEAMRSWWGCLNTENCICYSPKCSENEENFESKHIDWIEKTLRNYQVQTNQ